MGTSAVGIRNPAELAEIAQDVPSEVRESHCRTCLWSGVECQSRSLYDARPAMVKALTKEYFKHNKVKMIDGSEPKI